jgi:hypothetical protein
VEVFEFGTRLIEVTILYPSNDDPVTLECFDLRSEMLFTMFRDPSGELVLRAHAEDIPLELIATVATIARERL